MPPLTKCRNMQPYFSEKRSAGDPARPQRPRSSAMKAGSNPSPTLCMQDYPRILQFSPPRRPCAPLPVCHRCFSHARRAVSARRTPATVGAQAAQLLGGPSRLYGPRTGFPSAPRRPCARCAIAAASGRARARRALGLPPTLGFPRRRIVGRWPLPPLGFAGHAGGAARRRVSVAALVPKWAHPARALLRLFGARARWSAALLGFLRRERAHLV